MKSFLLFLIIILLAGSHVSFAQKRRAERAYEYFNSGEYFLAIDHFKNTYSKSKDKATKADMVLHGC